MNQIESTTKRLRAASERVKAIAMTQHQAVEKTSRNATESVTAPPNDDASEHASEDAIARQVAKVARTQGNDAAYQLNILLRMRERLSPLRNENL